MRYYKSGKSHANYKPKKGWRGFSGPKKRRVVHYEEAAALRYSNPFAKKSSKLGLRLKQYILPFVLFSWVGLMFYLPEFQITNISYSGLNIIKPEELESAVKDKFFATTPLIPKNNFFLLREKSVRDFLHEKFLLNALTVTKEFPNKLVIAIQESVSSAIFDNGREYYLLSDKGVAIKYLRAVKPSEFVEAAVQISSSSTSTVVVTSTTTTPSSTIKTDHIPDYKSLVKDYGSFPVLLDLREPEVKEREAPINTTTLSGFLAFHNALERGKVADTHYATINEPSAGITVYTDKPWKIIFQPDSDINQQISNLQVILKNSRPTEYVDLRFGERIYWK